MTCSSIEPELIGYHFNLVEGPARERIEAHLVECPDCVRAFVALKRALETSEDVPPPSHAARARLRLAVARELGVGEPSWSWWERPFAIALAASAVLVAGATTRALTTRAASAPYAISEQR